MYVCFHACGHMHVHMSVEGPRLTSGIFPDCSSHSSLEQILHPELLSATSLASQVSCSGDPLSLLLNPRITGEHHTHLEFSWVLMI